MSASPARAALVGLAATGLLVLGNARWNPRPGDPLALRWTRTAAAHPVRTWLALTLLVAALGPAGTRSAEPGARDSEGGPSAP
jgi:hypothetical protein